MLDFAILAQPEAWAALATLVVMEVVLGIDNLIFISILSNKLPPEHRQRTRRIGIGLALIVKMDDIGLHLAERRSASARALGRALVHAMPMVLGGLATIGTAAMLWVGGGILVHGMHEYHLDAVPGLVERLGHAAGSVPLIGSVTGWAATAAASAVVGLLVGGVIVAVMHFIPRKRAAH